MGTTENSVGNGFAFCLNGDNINQLFFANFYNTIVYSNYEIKEDGTWKHVAYTRSGTVGTFYVNGIAVKTVAGAAGTDGTNMMI